KSSFGTSCEGTATRAPAATSSLHKTDGRGGGLFGAPHHRRGALTTDGSASNPGWHAVRGLGLHHAPSIRGRLEGVRGSQLRAVLARALHSMVHGASGPSFPRSDPVVRQPPSSLRG